MQDNKLWSVLPAICCPILFSRVDLAGNIEIFYSVDIGSDIDGKVPVGGSICDASLLRQRKYGR